MFEELTPYAISIILWLNDTLGPVGFGIIYIVWLVAMHYAIKPITHGE